VSTGPASPSAHIAGAIRGAGHWIVVVLAYAAIVAATTVAITVEGMLLTASSASACLAVVALAATVLLPCGGIPAGSISDRRAELARGAAGVTLLALAAISARARSDQFWLAVALIAALLLRGVQLARARTDGRGAGAFVADCGFLLALFGVLCALISIPSVVVLGCLIGIRHFGLIPELHRRRLSGARVAAALALVLGANVVLSNITQAASEVRGCRVSPELRSASGEPERGTIRVATLGDSSTYGFFVPDRFTYAVTLERLLNGDSPTPRFRVLNCGVGGARSADLAAEYARARLHSPSIVTIYIGVNDGLADDAPFSDRPQRYRDQVRSVIESARRDGARVLLLTSPIRFAVGDRARLELHRSLNELGRELDVPVLDVDRAFGAKPLALRYMTIDMMHPNAHGHARIAELIRDAVAP